MKTVFVKGDQNLTGKDALISFFINESTKDTLRVLHLASYANTELEHLEAGVYEEEFYFDVPQSVQIQGRKHQIRLFRKDGYLPFFSRPDYNIKCLYEFGGEQH